MNWPTPAQSALASPSDSFSFRLLLGAEGFRSTDQRATCIPDGEFADGAETLTGSRGDFETAPLASTAPLTLSEAIQELTRVLVELLPNREAAPAAAAPTEEAGLVFGPSVVPAEPRPADPPVPHPEAFVSTKGVACHLRVRPARLYALCDQALADGVAQRTGSGERRQHVRWRLDRLGAWWRSQS